MHKKKLFKHKKFDLVIRSLASRGLAGAVLAVLVFSIFTTLVTIFPEKAQAAPGNNALLLIGENCHDLNDINHDFNITDPLGGERCSANDFGSSLAQSWEETVQDKLGCGGMFVESTLTNGEKKWYTIESEYKGCVEKAGAQLKRLKEQCDGVVIDTDKGDGCASNDLNLQYALGCDFLLDRSGSVYRINQSAISACQSQIDKAAAARIWKVVNGQSVQSAVPVSDPSVASAGGSGSAGPDDANCEGGGALGWIICPVSELIANFTTDMFEDVIAPMLENVPISLKREGAQSGGFQAWQSIRAIANVLLVVSLLAVVYSQAKGGD